MLTAIGAGSGLGDGVEDRDAKFLSDAAGGVRDDIMNTGELDFAGVGQLGVNARVLLAERAGAKDGDADFVCAARCVLGGGHGREIATEREGSSKLKFQR